MDVKTVINQLKKALASKDDKELRLRVEVLADMLEETQPVPLTLPIQPRYEEPVQQAQPGTFRSPRAKGPSGPGAIVGGEQLTYRRPPNT